MAKGKTAAKAVKGLPANTFILDNGAYTIKAGFAPQDTSNEPETIQQCRSIPNSLVRPGRDKKVYVAAQQDEIRNWSEATFRRPVERGQLVNWEAQKEIWDHSFFDQATAHRDVLIREPGETTLVLTEAPNSMAALQKNADEVVMEEWGFGGYARVIGPSLNAYNDLRSTFGDAETTQSSASSHQPQECLLVVDSGYSHTTITPLLNGIPIHRAIRRLDIGGKHLTNALKEVLSVRHFDLRQDTKIVNDIKEDVCFVSTEFKTDMERAWKGNRRKGKVASRVLEQPVSAPERTQKTGDMDMMDVDNPTNEPTQLTPSDPLIEWVLPDGIHLLRGFARTYIPPQSKSASSPTVVEVSMTLGAERFSIPELIFTPSDIGSRQPGLAETIIQSLSTLPTALQVAFLGNILVVGGCVKLKRFKERLQQEVRMLAPTEVGVRVRAMGEPVVSTWLGGVGLAADGNREILREMSVTREEYNEFGSGWTGRKFATAGRG